ncbi:hypothetical protein [Mumia quercus]|uniref:hypothetical protein n=1 Tax=Mumia quercus TaxID=2976125 RepID=UPI0021D0C63A|nr:hypothetical protein [Mumia quercus]
MNHTIRVPVALAGTALIAGSLVAVGPSATADDVNIHVAPIRTIKGPTNTGLAGPVDLDVRDGKIFVSNADDRSLSVFAAGANGDVRPLRRISGAASLITNPHDVSVDSAGFTWVADLDRVFAFAPTADGNVAPDAVFDPGINPYGIAVDRSNKVNVSDLVKTIRVFPISATGTPAAERTITSSHLTNARGLAVDGANRLWVANGLGASVVAFAPGAIGDAEPVRVIKGPRTQIQFATDVALDAAGRVYVVDHHAKNVKVFAATANGDVAPIKVLGGPAAALTMAAGAAVAREGTLVVADYGGDDISSFAPLFAPVTTKPVPKPAVKVPGKPRALKVAGKRGAKTRKVSWRAPSSNGGARITGYRLVVKRGNKTLVKRTFGASRRSFTLKRAKLRSGRVTVFVKAKNAKGYGKNATKSFRVRK